MLDLNNLPPEIKQLADSAGLDLNDPEVIKTVEAMLPQEAKTALAEPAPQEAVSDVEGKPAETGEEKLARELAVQQQENDQLKRAAQIATEGKVVGGGGLGVPAAEPAQASIADIEPGIRWAYRNGIISDEELENRVPKLFADLLKADKGGAV